jgi:hypothetical protein
MPLVSCTTATSAPIARSFGASSATSVSASSSVGPLRLPKFGSAAAACGSSFQSMIATSDLAT